MKEFQIKAFDVEVTVNDEKFEDGLKELQEALDSKQEELDQKLADLDQQVKDMADKVSEDEEAIAGLKGEKEALEAYKKSVTDVFGEDAKPEDMKLAKDTAAAFREYEISNRFIRYKGLMGMIDNEEEERKFLETLTTAEITKQANYYEKELIKRNPQLSGTLPINNDELVTNPDPKKDEPKKVELPVSHFRW